MNRGQLVIDVKSSEQERHDIDIRQEVIPYSADFSFDLSPSVAYFDADLLKEMSIKVRPIRQGDRFHPFGMKGTKLVSDLLTDMKLSIAEKEQQQLLCANDQIIWVIGRRSSEDYKVTEKTKNVLVCRLSH